MKTLTLNFSLLFFFLSFFITAQECNDEVYYGEGTYYGGIAGSSGGNCSLPVDAGDYLHCALNNVEYDGSNACGSCISVTGPNGTIKLKVVDRCPECSSGDVDMTQEAFAQIANVIDGRVDISYKFVPCELDTSDNIKIVFKSGSSIYWTGIQFRDIEHAITSMEYKATDGSWQSVDRQLYNYFVESSGIQSPMDLRVTSILGEQLIFEDVPLFNSVTYDTGLQFSTPTECSDGDTDSEICSTSSERPELVGKTVRIHNPSSSYWAQISGTSNYDHVRLNTENNTGGWTKWVVEEVVSGSNYYYRFKNLTTGKRLRASGQPDIEIAPTNFTGALTQWEIIPTSTDEYLIKNVNYGTYLSAGNNSLLSTLQHVDAASDALLTWSFKDVDNSNTIIDCNGSSASKASITTNDKFNIYTNAKTKTITVDSNVIDNVSQRKTVRLINLSGQVIQEKTTTSETTDIVMDINNQATGVYFIHVLENNELSQTQKIILK